jgi:hypothetical protein
VILRRIGGERAAAVIEQDQLVVLRPFIEHQGIPEAHGGEEAVDHQQRLALAPGVVSHADVTHLGELPVRAEASRRWSRQGAAHPETGDGHDRNEALDPGVLLREALAPPAAAAGDPW